MKHINPNKLNRDKQLHTHTYIYVVMLKNAGVAGINSI